MMKRPRITHQEDEAQSIRFTNNKSKQKNQHKKKNKYFSQKNKLNKKSKAQPSFCCYQYYKYFVCSFLVIVLLPLAFAAFSNQLNNNLEEVDQINLNLNLQSLKLKNDKKEQISSVKERNNRNNEQNQIKIKKQPTILSQTQNQNFNNPDKIKSPPQQNKVAPTSIASRAGITAQQVTQAKEYLKLKDLPKDDPLAQKQFNYYEGKYKISTYEQFPICVVVPTYNNAKDNRHYHNMDSILQQNYQNYHIVFIDDASNDTTAVDMRKYFLQKNLQEPKVKFIVNSERAMAMPNLLMAAKNYCKPQQIFIIVDGDDQLIGKQVFKHFNSVFHQKQVWVMYSNFLASRGSVGYSRPFSQATIQRNAYRKAGFVISHLRAFYTKLFLLIKQEDLKDASGNFFKAANDVAICLPILEMSHKRVIYSPEISYYYNSNTGLNNHRVRLKQQKDNQRYIRKKASYEALKQLFPALESSQELDQQKKSIV